MTRTPARGVSGDIVAVLLAFAALGVSCGVLWWLTVDLPLLTKTRGGSTMGEVELAKSFNADGLYAVLALVAGFLGGAGVTWWRSRDFGVTTVLLVPGAALAAVLMTYVGHVLGPDDPDLALRQVRVGETVPEDLVLTTGVGYLLWPIAALLGALMVLWSSTGVGPSEGLSGDERSVDIDALPPPSPDQRLP